MYSGLGNRVFAETKPQNLTRLDALKNLLSRGIAIFGTGLDLQVNFKIETG